MTRVREPELERQGRRLGGSGAWFLLLAVALAIPGALLVAFGGSSASGVGIIVLALAAATGFVAIGLLLSSAVARWAARHRPFA